jgi:predicted DNA-binding transcriptional regulator AlpA
VASGDPDAAGVMSAIDLKAEGYPVTMRPRDLCRLFGICLNTLYARIEAGRVPRYQKHGRRYEWFRHDVEQWMANPPRQSSPLRKVAS